VPIQKHPCDRPAFIIGLVLLSVNSALSIDTSIPVLPVIADALQAPSQTAPLIVGFFLMGLALGQLPAGVCADRFGRLPVLYVGLTIFILAGLVTITTDNITVMLIARFVQGLGASMGPILGRAIARDISDGPRTITLISMITAALAVTTIISPLLGSLLATIGGWRLTLMAPTAFGVVILVYNLIFLSETRPQLADKHSVLEQIKHSIAAFTSERQCMVAAALIGLSFGAYFVLLSLCSSILNDVYGFNVQEIGLLFSLIVIPYISCSLLSGKITKYLRKNRMLECALISQLLVSLAMLTMFAVGDVIPFGLFWSVCAVFMAGMGVIFPATVAMAMGPLGNSAGIASSIIGTFQIGISTIFVAVASVFYDHTINSVAIFIGFTGIVSFIVYFKNRSRLQ
jgi:DHA1 family bicyclomycin/chloramphenicol resistance-like MFS transporter